MALALANGSRWNSPQKYFWTPLSAELSRASWVPFCEEMPLALAIIPSTQPPSPTSEGQRLPAGPGRRPPLGRAAAGWLAGSPPRAPAQSDLSSPRAGGGGRREKGELRGGKGQTLKLPGCGLRARMLSVLPTSWQRHLGPGRRRRCGNGAARVAEPALAPARSRPEALPALASAPRPLRGRERVRGAGRPRERGPRGGGGPGARGGPARAGSGAAPRRGGLARTPRGGGRGGLRAAGGSDGPGALADEPRRESGPPSPSPESRSS